MNGHGFVEIAVIVSLAGVLMLCIHRGWEDAAFIFGVALLVVSCGAV